MRISALPSRDAADAEWARLRDRWATETPGATEIAGLDHAVAAYTRSGRTYWSLRVIDVGSTRDAAVLCGMVEATAVDCSVLPR